MPINSDVPWRDLDTRGFVHIPGFLTPAELQACVADYASRPPGANGNYDVPGAGEGISALVGSFHDLMAAVTANTDVYVDCFVGAYYFAIRRGIRFQWHQDHESYFWFQSHANFLNCYIAVAKPRPDKTNLSVVPFDVLERESPEIFRRTLHAGATTVKPLPGGGQLLVSDDSGIGHATRLNFDDVACTPHLDAGDLLLLRGDVFHKTQDSDTERVALSIRLASTKTMVRRSKLAAGGLAKSRMMVRNMSDFERAFRAFELSGRGELTWGELQRLIAEAETGHRPTSSPKRYLLGQKLRAGVILSSARSAANEVVVNRLKYLYHRHQPRKVIGRMREQGAS